MMTGIFLPVRAVSLGRTMSTAITSSWPSLSVSIVVSTYTDSRIAFA